MAGKLWDLAQNPKNKRWFLEIKEGLPADSYPSGENLREAAIQRGIDPMTLVSNENVEKNLKKAIAVAGEEFSFPITIDPTFDVRIIVSPDKTKASLYIRKAADQRNTVDLKLVSAAINNARIKGIDPVKTKNAIFSFASANTMELSDFALAEGTPAKRGKNRELIAKIEWLEGEEAKELKGRLERYVRQQAASPAEQALPLAEAERLAYVSKGQIAFEISPVESGEPGIDVYGKEIPGLPGNDPLIQTIEGLSLGKEGIKAERSGVLLSVGDSEKQRLRIIPFLNSAITPIISGDNMSVSILLEPEEGAGVPLSADGVPAMLEAKGIHGKIDLGALASAVEETRASKTSREVTVLRGQPPVKPGSTRITWFTGDPTSEGSVTVAEGDRILSIEKFPSGANGQDVFGRTIPAESGVDMPEPGHDESIAETSEGAKRILVASKAGELLFSAGLLTVSKTRKLTGNVDEKSGDVSFPGDLSIEGNILAGRSVKASGSLSVTGNAEASLVSGDSGVTMGGGITGAGRGVVWSKQDIRLAFAENARILAGQNVYVDNYCFQCSIKTNGTLFMRGNPGVLLGGSIRSTKGIEVFELGSEKTIRTSVSFGQNYLIGDQIEVCEREAAKIRETVERINEEMKKTSGTDPRIHELRRKKVELLKRNDKLTVRVFTLKEQFETHIISHVRVENTVYPGVILESHGRYYEIRERKNHVIFIFDQASGQITCNPL